MLRRMCGVTRFDKMFKQMYEKKFASIADIAKKMNERIDWDDWDVGRERKDNNEVVNNIGEIRVKGSRVEGKKRSKWNILGHTREDIWRR